MKGRDDWTTPGGLNEMTGLIELSSAKSQDHGPVSDGETLAFLIEKLRPSIRAAIRQGIGQNFAALDVCLIQLEQVISASPDFESKATIAREIMVIRTLCDRIQKDLSRS